MTPPARALRPSCSRSHNGEVEDMPGHRLLALLGKRSLRPGARRYAIHELALQSAHLDPAAATETCRRHARKTFHRHRRPITAVSLIAHLPSNEATS